METFHHTNLRDIESNRAQWSQWEASTDNGSVMADKKVNLKMPQAAPHQRRPVVVEEEKYEEAEDSLTMLNDLVNPFNSIKRYLIKNKYISEKNQNNQNETSQKMVDMVEEFSQNFYYAFIAQAVLKLGKGLMSSKRNLIPITIKLFKRNNLSMWAFLAVLGAGYKFVFDKLRKLSDKYDKINTLISICLAAWSLMNNKVKNKTDYMYFLVFWKYLEVMSKILEKGKVIKKVKNFNVEFYELAFLQFTIRFSLRVKISRKD